MLVLGSFDNNLVYQRALKGSSKFWGLSTASGIKTEQIAGNRVSIRAAKNWLFESATNSFLLYALTAAYLYFFIILNRWVFTDLGLQSFGRVWQFYVNYGDLGFVRRALLGTVLTITRLNVLISNEYVLAYSFSAILGIIIAVFAYYLMKGDRLSRAVVLGIGFSPSFLAHFGYSTGSFDLLLFVLLCIAVVKARNLTVVCFVAAIGVLSHELFFFYVPFISVISLLAKNDKPTIKDLKLPVCIIAFSILVLLALKLFTAPAVNESQYVSIMAPKMPKAAYKHPLWSGYFELYSTVSENLSVGKQYLELLLTRKGVLALIPVGYAILLVFLCTKNAANNLLKAVLAFGIAFPFFVSFIAADFLRWVCMSEDCGLLTIIVFAKRGYLNIGDRFSSALLAFCLLSPFGAAQLDWPFPLHQFVFEKLLHLLK